MTVVDKDHGWKALGERLDDMSRGTYVLVGIQGSEGTAQHGADGLTNIELGTLHEFGVGVPQRSFIRTTIDDSRKHLSNLLAKLGQRVVMGELPEAAALGAVGEQAVGLIKQRIASHIPPPLAAETIARKGTDVPLIEHGTLISSITWKLWSRT